MIAIATAWEYGIVLSFCSPSYRFARPPSGIADRRIQRASEQHVIPLVRSETTHKLPDLLHERSVPLGISNQLVGTPESHRRRDVARPLRMEYLVQVGSVRVNTQQVPGKLAKQPEPRRLDLSLQPAALPASRLPFHRLHALPGGALRLLLGSDPVGRRNEPPIPHTE